MKHYKLGYLMEFHPDGETKDWVTREDLASEDQEKKNLVQSWIVGLAEPWCESAVSYCININQGNEVVADEAHKWVAACHSIFYDCLESVLVAYGATPEDALQNVRSEFAEMIKIYCERYKDNKDA